MQARKAKVLAFALLLFILGLAATIATGAPTPVSIWSPRLVNPAFAQPGDIFTVEVAGPAEVAADGWQAYLANDLREWPVAITSVIYETINRDTQPGWVLSIEIPTDFPPELFDLRLVHSSGVTLQSPRSVSVVDDFETDFYILHMPDEHARYARASEANGYRSFELMRWAAPVINLINPRFVFNTGDVTYQYESNGVRRAGNQLHSYALEKLRYTVPSLVVAGNHDIPGSVAAAPVEWEAELGQRSFVTRLGSFWILAHDYSDYNLRTWAAKQYEQSLADPTIQFRLIGQHYVNSNAFMPTTGKLPDLMLVGHIHQTRPVQTTPYPVLMTIASHRYSRAGFIEFRKTPTGWEHPRTAGWSGSDVLELVGDWGVPKVRATYAAPNDGTATANTVSISNQLPQSFSDGRVRFLLARGSYEVTGGVKLAEYNYADDTKTAVLVKVNIAALGQTTVSVAAVQD